MRVLHHASHLHRVFQLAAPRCDVHVAAGALRHYLVVDVLGSVTRAQCLTLWGGPQHVATAHAILKLLCELSHNKSQRITVSWHSFNHMYAGSLSPHSSPISVRRLFAQWNLAVQGSCTVSACTRPAICDHFNAGLSQMCVHLCAANCWLRDVSRKS